MPTSPATNARYTESEPSVDDIVHILFGLLQDTDKTMSQDCFDVDLCLDCLNMDQVVAPSAESEINNKRPSDRIESALSMDMLCGTGS